jgi:hypothetical protein
VVGAAGGGEPTPNDVTERVPPLVVTAAIALAICCATTKLGFDDGGKVTVEPPVPGTVTEAITLSV